MLIEGVFAAVTTPFYPDERIYFRKIEANIAHYSRTLLAGMVILGSTGEAIQLDDNETRDVLRVAAEAAAPEKVLIAGVSRESVKATVALAEAAAGYRYDAVLVRTPTYYAGQISKAAVLHYFRSVADRSPLPVLLYNIPQCAPYNIPIDVVAELAQHPNIIGIKESSGSLERVRELVAQTSAAPRRSVTVTPIFEAVTGRMTEQNQSKRALDEYLKGGFSLRKKPLEGGAPVYSNSDFAIAPRARNSGTFVSAVDLAGGTGVAVDAPAPPIKTRTREIGFQVLNGSSSTLLASLQAGVSGAILAFAACAPQACQEVYMAWKDHDLKLAQEKQERIVLPSRRIVSQLGISAIKYACDFNGYYGGRARSPLLPLNATEKAEIEALLAGTRN